MDRRTRRFPGRPRRSPDADADDPGAGPRVRRRADPQDALAVVRRDAGRVGADALPEDRDQCGAYDDVRLVAGRLRDELPVLRHRAGGADPQPVGGRDRRAGRGRCSRAGPWRGGRRSRSGQQRRLHGHGRAAGQLQGGDDGAARPRRPGAGRAGHLGPRRHRVDGRPRAADRAARRRRTPRSRSPCRCTRPTTSCATSWSRSTPAGPWPRCSTRPGPTRGARVVGCRSSTR